MRQLVMLAFLLSLSPSLQEIRSRTKVCVWIKPAPSSTISMRSVDNRLFTCVDRNWCWRNHNACLHARASEREKERKNSSTLDLISVHLRILHLSIYWRGIDKLIIKGFIACKFILRFSVHSFVRSLFSPFLFIKKTQIKHQSSCTSLRQ